MLIWYYLKEKSAFLWDIPFKNISYYIDLLLLAWKVNFMIKLFANGLGDLGSIQGCVIPKTLKMVLDTSLFNSPQYKIHIKDKVEQS